MLYRSSTVEFTGENMITISGCVFVCLYSHQIQPEVTEYTSLQSVVISFTFSYI